jgi:hypothetical protein
MKLIKLTSSGAEYFLNATELHLLDSVLQKFPFTPDFPGRISLGPKDRAAREREKLLNESLVEHRRELTRAARNLLAPEKLTPWKKGHLLTLAAADGESLLQILNDVRVGCWQALGQPEELEPRTPELSDQEFAWRNLMHLAGYFEHSLLGGDETEK